MSNPESPAALIVDCKSQRPWGQQEEPHLHGINNRKKYDAWNGDLRGLKVPSLKNSRLLPFAVWDYKSKLSSVVA
ncbi:hypothetical protein Y1Q_0012526 [Alligator mississippiensis]|uniref:Uncharacterized protein n=1 Tax=Alligator mississippiensis TaxID=8496 RepID=A0A151M7Y8_ALLMI|nr:hypothetical protein Y1Q_0012526 [Alligator mississippiensis]